MNKTLKEQEERANELNMRLAEMAMRTVKWAPMRDVVVPSKLVLNSDKPISDYLTFKQAE